MVGQEVERGPDVGVEGGDGKPGRVLEGAGPVGIEPEDGPGGLDPVVDLGRGDDEAVAGQSSG